MIKEIRASNMFVSLHPAIYSTTCYIKLSTSLSKVLVVLDTGSSSTIIDQDFAQHNKLRILAGPYKKNVRYVDRPASYQTYDVLLTLAGQDTKVTHTLSAQTVENFSKSCILHDWFTKKSNFKHLTDLVILKSPDPPVGTMLIGTDNAFLFDVFETRRGSKLEPIANRTPLGWAFMGPSVDSTELQYQEQIDQVMKCSDDFLAQIVARQFDLEEYGLQEQEQRFSKGFSGGPKDPATWSTSELNADNKLVISYDKVNKIFTVNIPWLENHKQKLIANFNPVKIRQEKSHAPLVLAKKDVKIEEIDVIINGYLEKGYIEPVPDKEQGQGWYLPFFEVVNRHKSTPIRLVFDAKASYKGVSLNSQIEDTPNRLNDLVLTLLNMRRYQYALTGDISEMFLRIRLASQDKQYHRFIHNSQHFQWTRILFGNKCSPNASQKVLDELHKLFEKTYPVAAKTLKESCYMDDCADSKPIEKDLQTLAVELPELLRQADMKICKFYTNSKLVIETLPRELLAKEIRFEDKDPFFDTNTVLGMVWDANSDQLTFKTKYSTLEEWKKACSVEQWTKRAVLKTTASTFDPLGLLSPIIMYPRTLIQQLWADKLGWDVHIGKQMEDKWEECLANILKVSAITFPRWIFDDGLDVMELHVFCDASESAYAATVYSRVFSRGGTIRTNLVMSKARVAPLKNETVARLELVACVIGTRLLHAVNLAYKVPQDRVFYYTDSRNALCWINTPSSKAKTYVFNRTAEIQRTTKSTQWSHVRTDLNPADIATRYVTTEDLANNKLWFEGPPFLRDPEYKFEHYLTSVKDLTKEGEAELKPITDCMSPPNDFYLHDDFDELDLEEEKCFAEFSNTNSEKNSGKDQEHSIKPKKNLGPKPRHEAWYKYIHKVSIGRLYNGFLRFRLGLSALFMRIHKGRNTKPIEIQKLVYNFLYRLSQRNSFPEELKILEKGKSLPSGNPLAKMNPYLDSFGVLRSNSRLDSLDYLPEETRRPILLLASDPITKLIVSEVHWDFEHAVSRSSVLATLHKKYYILGLSKLVRALSSNCIECRKIRAKPIDQIMAPVQSLEMPQRSFAETGLDFAGPFEIVQGRGKHKAQQFVLLFTCLQTRAVHFEPTRDQTTDSVLNAITRFCAIRGRPRKLVSDNQTSFRSTSKELQSFHSYFETHQPRIEGILNRFGDPIEWTSTSWWSLGDHGEGHETSYDSS
jgi:Pao retrotransposon peptidase/Reverse transcriptase (RNA-dependent DNA polymerase)